ncbi:MAG: hypothetical protein IKG69_08650 [Atopobiaceae bacterium]|nr:hypothetical protein [Atopobiaceae bacterium]
MTYIERLRDVNSRIRTTNIKGKEYAEVAPRIMAFWELFPEGSIVTECTTTDTRCDCRCEVYRKETDERPAATGHAFEIKQGQINSTSYVENCETSAIGRALGILGIGSTQAICSKEELEGALALQAKQEEPKRDHAELNALVKELAAKEGLSVPDAAARVVEKYGNPKEMGDAAYKALLFALRSEVEKGEA